MIERTVKEMYTDNISQSPDYCRIVSERHFTRLQGLLDKTKGNIVVGGKGAEIGDKFIPPTVVTGVGDQSLTQVLIK